MRFIGLFASIVLFINVSCSSSKSTPPGAAMAPQSSLALAAWESTAADARGFEYRLELEADGALVARVFQSKVSPVFTLNEEKEIVPKIENKAAIVHNSAWEEQSQWKNGEMVALEKATLSRAFLKFVIESGINKDTAAWTYEDVQLVPTAAQRHTPVLGVFEHIEEQWVFQSVQKETLLVSYEQVQKFDYQVNLQTSQENQNTYLRVTTVQRRTTENQAYVTSSWISPLEALRQKEYFSEVVNGRVVEFQVYQKEGQDIFPVSDVVSLYMPVFKIRESDIQWKVDLEPWSAFDASYKGRVTIDMPFDLSPYHLPRLEGVQTIIEKKAGLTVSMGISAPVQEGARRISAHFTTYQTADIKILLGLNVGHRYFDSVGIALRYPRVPIFVLLLSHITFSCKKQNNEFIVQWQLPEPFAMSARIDSVLKETSREMPMTQSQTHFQMSLPVLTNDAWFQFRFQYRDPYNGAVRNVEHHKNLSDICPQ